MLEQNFNSVISVPKTAGDRIYIEVPFNVWEVFHQKGRVPVAGTINGFSFSSSLIPRGNGNYIMLVSNKILKTLDTNPSGVVQVVMGLNLTEKVMETKQEIIKKKRVIQYVPQPTSETCGQACIAMLSGAGMDEVIKVMHTSGPTSIGQLIEALDYYQIGHAAKNVRLSKKNPTYSETSILTVHMSTYTHWVLYHKGKYYDPEFGVLDQCHPDGNITSFLEIFL